MTESGGIHKSVLALGAHADAAPALLLAVLLHVGLVVAAIVLPRFLDHPAPVRKPVIARLVALGKPRDKSLLPRKETPAPAGHAAPSVPGKAVQLAKPAPSRPAAPSRRELMEKALARAAGRASADDEKPDPDRPGQETGSPEGTAQESEAGDAYFTAVHDAILANYVVPSVISERERMALSATVLAYIGRDGSLIRHEFQKKSGNGLFDSALESAMQRTRLPPPPPELQRLLRDDGILLNFRP